MSTPPRTIGERAARQLSNTTKTPPQWRGTTPRWLVQMIPWTPVEAGVFRVNQALDDKFDLKCSPELGEELPVGFSDYEPNPREYVLTSVTTTIEVDTRVSDLFRSPMDQVKEQLTLTIDKLKERQEAEVLRNRAYGLLNNVDPDMRIKTRKGPPTPDDLDELISTVWKEPAFFVAHPKAIAAFGRECTRRGVPPPTVNMFGSPFLTWRGLPLVPSDKVPVKDNKSSILLMRTGERKRGVVGLFQPGLPGAANRPQRPQPAVGRHRRPRRQPDRQAPAEQRQWQPGHLHGQQHRPGRPRLDRQPFSADAGGRPDR